MTHTQLLTARSFLSEQDHAPEYGDEALLGSYLDFLLDWIETDIGCYRNAVTTAPGHEVKKLLSCMAVRKERMFESLSVYPAPWSPDRCRPAAAGSPVFPLFDMMFDNDLDLIQSLSGAFHFAYRKEFQNLHAFEKTAGSGLGTPIRTLMENAIEHQRGLIMHLDARLSQANQRSGLPVGRPTGVRFPVYRITCTGAGRP